jgi:nitroimidazol reductase NimA-like FMN-containing flavoprotein (pyridoxamine 5'-phosphate oxidase superfamily)
MTDGGSRQIEALSGMECYRLLATQQVGRLGVDVGRYPLIFPVNYALDGDTILVRTRPDTTLTAADYANVAFEVDAIDPRTRSGWSVLVRGLAEDVTATHRGESQGESHEDTQARGPQPWPPGEHGRWIRIVPHGISGRRIVPASSSTSVPPA